MKIKFKNDATKKQTLGSVLAGDCFLLVPFSENSDPDTTQVFIRAADEENLETRIEFVSLRTGKKFLEMPNFEVVPVDACCEV